MSKTKCNASCSERRLPYADRYCERDWVQGLFLGLGVTSSLWRRVEKYSIYCTVGHGILPDMHVDGVVWRLPQVMWRDVLPSVLVT